MLPGRMRSGARRAIVASACLAVACGCTRSSLRSGDGAGGAAPDGSTSPPPDSGDGGTPPPDIILFRLAFVSDIPEAIFVDETDPAWQSTGHWLRIRKGGAAIRKAAPCEICRCDDCPNCPICGAPCPTVTKIDAPGAVEWEWSGMTHPEADCPNDPTSACIDSVRAAAGSYTAEFCWGTAYEGTLPCPADVLDLHCAEVPFTYPDADGLVDYLVNNSG